MAGERILVVDDEKLIRMSLADELGEKGYAVEAVGTGAAAVERIDAAPPDLVLLDYNLPDLDGHEVLRRTAARHPDIVFLLMTAYSSLENAVQAVKLGAYDYVRKPYEPAELLLRIEKGLETTALRREVRLHAVRSREEGGLARLVGKSPAMQRLREQIRLVAQSGASTVLLLGESGTGKDAIARAIHAESDRARMPFVNVTCTAIPESLLESELFGHERGAFTDAKAGKKGMFEMARGGTVFLDEIGDMPPVLQAKILRFLEERSFRRVGGTEDIAVDVRIIAATNRDLGEAVKRGDFRTDLYYRIKVIQIDVPPLRDRLEDVPMLAQTFIDQLRREFRARARTLSAAAIARLGAYPWPGNIRELRNAVERALILGAGEEIRPEDLPVELDPARGGAATPHLASLPSDGVRLADVEEALVRQAFERTGGNQTRAARLLGLTRDQYRYRLERIGLLAPPPARRTAAEA
jgi:two-component system response regulator AtoC